MLLGAASRFFVGFSVKIQLTIHVNRRKYLSPAPKTRETDHAAQTCLRPSAWPVLAFTEPSQHPPQASVQKPRLRRRKSMESLCLRAAPVSALASGPAFEALLDGVRDRARLGEFDRQRHISRDVIDAFKAHGVYRALVPKRFGGLECSPGAFCEMVERIARRRVGRLGRELRFRPGLPRRAPPGDPGRPLRGRAGRRLRRWPLPGAARRGHRQAASWSTAGGSAPAAAWAPTSSVSASPATSPPAASRAPCCCARTRSRSCRTGTSSAWRAPAATTSSSRDVDGTEGVDLHPRWHPHRRRAALPLPLAVYAAQVLAVVGVGIARAALDYCRGMSPAAAPG